ncbi:MAG: XRE family transcriptional regulator [Myxococcaceae bacterium]|nr:MAG: XRE family transcriptional regulator [Myxococcaceae bacterium]
MDTIETGKRLHHWRATRDPKRTVVDLATAVGVKHPTWLDWENGSRSPSLAKAMALELLTDAEVPMEGWGFAADVVSMMREIVARRGAAALTEADEPVGVGGSGAEGDPEADQEVAADQGEAGEVHGPTVASATHCRESAR